MYNILIEDLEIDYDYFVDLHGTEDAYGGSSVANICGVGYDSPLKEWLRRTGKEKPIEQTDQMRLGHHMEPFLCELFTEHTGKRVNSINQVWQSEERPWMIATPDGLTEMDEIVEFKTHKIYADKYWQDGASDSAMCQLQWYLAVSGKDAGYCAALIGGDTDKFYPRYFEADTELQGQLIEQVQKFRELVQADTPPDAGPGDAKLIQQHLLEEYDKQKELDLTFEHGATMHRYRELAEETDKLAQELDPRKKEMQMIKNQFLLDCQGAGTIIVGKDRVRLTKVTKKEHTVKGSEYFRVSIKLEDE